MATKTKTKTKIRPLDDRVLIKPDVAEDRTSSGIYLPEGAKEKPITGKVIAVGPGKLADDGTRTAITVKVGETVVYGKYTGTEVELDDEQHVLAKEGELLGVLDKK